VLPRKVKVEDVGKATFAAGAGTVGGLLTNLFIEDAVPAVARAPRIGGRASPERAAPAPVAAAALGAGLGAGGGASLVLLVLVAFSS